MAAPRLAAGIFCYNCVLEAVRFVCFLAPKWYSPPINGRMEHEQMLLAVVTVFALCFPVGAFDP
jgi:hypothetical protein